MLVVILILGVLMALVVGVGKNVMIEAARRKTILIQDQLVNAIRAFQDARGSAPTEPGPVAQSSSPTDYGYTGAKNPTEWAAAVRNADLYSQLMGEPASQKVLSSLPPEAVYKPTVSFMGDTTGKYRLFRDGFDVDMDYRASAGLGGRPVVISGGPDGHFGTGSGNVNYDNDNIYSDGRGR